MNALELVDYLFAVSALLVGVVVGRRAEKRKWPKPIRPICTCTHGYGTHDDGGRCSGHRQVADGWDFEGDAIHWTNMACPCRRYDGPDPLMLGLTS